MARGVIAVELDGALADTVAVVDRLAAVVARTVRRWHSARGNGLIGPIQETGMAAESKPGLYEAIAERGLDADHLLRRVGRLAASWELRTGIQAWGSVSDEEVRGLLDEARPLVAGPDALPRLRRGPLAEPLVALRRSGYRLRLLTLGRRGGVDDRLARLRLRPREHYDEEQYEEARVAPGFRDSYAPYLDRLFDGVERTQSWLIGAAQSAVCLAALRADVRCIEVHHGAHPEVYAPLNPQYGCSFPGSFTAGSFAMAAKVILDPPPWDVPYMPSGFRLTPEEEEDDR